LSGEGRLIYYWIGRALCRFLLFFIWRWDVEGLENFPSEGPVIVVANHVSYWDPVLIGSALPRQVFFMAKKELFSIPVLGFSLKSWGVFPVDRSRPDRGAIKRALDLLKQGQVVVVFPEGTRSKTGSLLPPSTGAAYFATRTGAPVCPAAIITVRGASSWGLWPRLSLRIGPCISFSGDRKQDLDSVAGQMMLEIQQLLAGSAT
jgi:1-acyl-sn-glycerol-3-phosphate acyltransferase